MTQPYNRLANKSSLDIAWSRENIAFTASIGLVWLLGSIVLLIFPPFLLLWTPICIYILMGGVAYQVVNQVQNRTNKTLRQKLKDTWSFVRSYWVSLVFASWMLSAAIFIGYLLLQLIVFTITSIPGIGGLIGSLLIIPMFICVLAILAVSINTYLLPCVVGVEKSGPIRSISLLVNVVTNNPLEMLLGYFKVLGSILPTGFWTGIITIAGTFASVLICKGSFAWQIANNPEASSGFLGFLDIGMLSISIGLIFFAWISYMLVFVSTGFTMLYYNVTRRGEVF